jgi:hypothetical protein
LQNCGEFWSGFIFQRIEPWTGSMPSWTGRARSVHRGLTAVRTKGGAGARRRAHRSSTSGRSGAPKLTGDRAASRRMGDGGEGSAASVLSERAAQAWREGKRSGEICGETRWGCSPFIGGRGSAGEGWPGSLTLALMALTPLKMGEGLKGELREGK